jgi:hypothetical protein
MGLSWLAWGEALKSKSTCPSKKRAIFVKEGSFNSKRARGGGVTKKITFAGVRLVTVNS